MKSAAIFDLDGTISDDRWRRPMIDPMAYAPADRYEQYHAAASMDKLVNGDVVTTSVADGHHIVFATARPTKFKESTDWWLQNHFPDLPYTLLMRSEDSLAKSPDLKLGMMKTMSVTHIVKIVYDDRDDVVNKLRTNGYNAFVMRIPATAADRLRAMAETCEQRQGMYGEVWRVVPRLVEVLFPKGVPPWLLTDSRWHLFELKLVKLARFAHSELRHQDSIHDDGVFSALIEHIIHEEETK